MNGDGRAKLAEIFEIVLDLEPADVESARRVTCERWDSLAMVSLVTAIESEFDLKLDTKEAARVTSFAAAVLLLEELGR
jgi:acyl carrier protein